jgi:F-type H+-transporting ATPase subunit epsilon
MLPTKLVLEVVTPERRLVNETVDEIVLPGKTGYLGVLPGHAPLLTSLSVGELMYRQGTQKHYVSIAWGFAEVLPERVIVLADIAERAEEIDLERAKAKKAEVEEEIRRARAEVDMDLLGASLEKSVVRIQVASRARGGGDLS